MPTCVRWSGRCNMNRKVSIIVPVYRAADTVERCVSSLVNGDYPDLEILLIEDCSPDDSWAVCQRLADTYPCVRAFRNEKNSGPSATRNRGLEEMTGQYLMFVDSDDWVEPNYVSAFVDIYLQHHPDLIVCGFLNHNEIRDSYTECFGWKEQSRVIPKSMKQELLTLYHGRLLQQIWNKFFLTDIIRRHNIRFDTSLRMGEDFRFLLNYLQQVSGDQLILLNLPLYHYIRCSANSLMSQFGDGKIEEALKNLQMLYRLTGMEETEIQQQLQKDREAQMSLWAYLIMHNVGMKNAEKKRLILAMDETGGRKRYRRQLTIYCKERVLALVKKMKLR